MHILWEEYVLCVIVLDISALVLAVEISDVIDFPLSVPVYRRKYINEVIMFCFKNIIWN